MRSSTIAAIASPPGVGAVALIRLSGAQAVTIAGNCFAGRPSTGWIPRQQHFGRIVDEAGLTLDEVLLTYFPGPRSFTGEDVIEIACHGGVLVTRRILELLLRSGAVPANPGEFSERAFLNGRIDLTQAEAIMDLISARTDLAMRAAGGQLEGRLGRAIEKIRLDLIALIAHVEAYIDFPEEDIEPDSTEALLTQARAISGHLSSLLSTAEQGRILREGVRTVICGPPNAGKSSLLNCLLGYDRAIVSEIAGTTRDTIEEYINLRGLPLHLIDTAGIREGLESIEREGIERARTQIALAELVLYVVDGSAASSGLTLPEIPSGARLVQILNKADLPLHPDWEGVDGFRISCFDERSIDALQDHLFTMLADGTGLASADLIAINARHQHWLSRAQEALNAAEEALAECESPEFVAVDLRSALDAVGEIVGKTDVEEILGEIFGRFCIGK